MHHVSSKGPQQRPAHDMGPLQDATNLTASHAQGQTVGAKQPADAAQAAQISEASSTYRAGRLGSSSFSYHHASPAPVGLQNQNPHLASSSYLLQKPQTVQTKAAPLHLGLHQWDLPKQVVQVRLLCMQHKLANAASTCFAWKFCCLS